MARKRTGRSLSPHLFFFLPAFFSPIFLYWRMGKTSLKALLLLGRHCFPIALNLMLSHGFSIDFPIIRWLFSSLLSSTVPFHQSLFCLFAPNCPVCHPPISVVSCSRGHTPPFVFSLSPKLFKLFQGAYVPVLFPIE